MLMMLLLLWSAVMIGGENPSHRGGAREATGAAGDRKPGRPQNVFPTIVVDGSYFTCFSNPGGGILNDDYGWTGTGEFVLSNSFTKLGGPLFGSGYSWVTAPGPPGTRYDTMKVSTVQSPFFDLTALSDVYVSFYHSMSTEPAWDFSMFQYSLDSGATWTTAGACDDPSGENWYGSCVYGSRCNLGSDDGCFEPESWNLLVGSPPPGENIWTSAGECTEADVPTERLGRARGEVAPARRLCPSRTFETVEELRQALLAFREIYNGTWLIERHGFLSPAEYRKRQLQPLAQAA